MEIGALFSQLEQIIGAAVCDHRSEFFFRDRF